MARFKLSARRGDTIPLLVPITRDDVPVDLTGASLTFTAKRGTNDDDAVFTKTIGAGIVVTDADAGEAVVTILPADTADFARDTVLICDVELIEADGAITTVADGTLQIVRDLTRAAV